MARPKIPIDEELLRKLTQLHLSTKVIAECLGVSIDTLERRFAVKMEEWRSKSKSKIAEILFDEGINKREPWALKALAQKHLDYSDKIKTENETTHAFSDITDEELDEKIQTHLEDLNIKSKK